MADQFHIVISSSDNMSLYCDTVILRRYDVLPNDALISLSAIYSVDCLVSIHSCIIVCMVKLYRWRYSIMLEEWRLYWAGWVYVHVCICMYMFMCVCAHVHVRANMYVDMYVCVHNCVHVYMLIEWYMQFTSMGFQKLGGNFVVCIY